MLPDGTFNILAVPHEGRLANPEQPLELRPGRGVGS
jgi:hypothetical protein